MVLVAGDVQVAEDVFQHAVGVHQDVVVPVADHLIAMRFDDRGPLGVSDAVGVLPAVERFAREYVLGGRYCRRYPFRDRNSVHLCCERERSSGVPRTA